MDITNERMKEMLGLLMTRAKYNREQAGYRGEFSQCAMVFGPRAEQAVIPLKWRDDDEKKIMCFAISKAARDCHASAVVMITDMRWILSDTLCAYFHIDKPDGTPEGMKRFNEAYHQIRRMYGGEIRLFPREVWNEALLVSCKGPFITEDSIVAPYVEGKNDTVRWVEMPLKPGEEIRTEMHMLDDWWDTPKKV